MAKVKVDKEVQALIDALEAKHAKEIKDLWNHVIAMESEWSSCIERQVEEQVENQLESRVADEADRAVDDKLWDAVDEAVEQQLSGANIYQLAREAMEYELDSNNPHFARTVLEVIANAEKKKNAKKAFVA